GAGRAGRLVAAQSDTAKDPGRYSDTRCSAPRRRAARVLRERREALRRDPTDAEQGWTEEEGDEDATRPPRPAAEDSGPDVVELRPQLVVGVRPAAVRASASPPASRGCPPLI